jgi:hypothetical protein
MRTWAEEMLGVKGKMPNEQTRPDRLIAVRRADLVEMRKWKCLRPASIGPCHPDELDNGAGCVACRASAFAEKALRGASAKLPKVEELRNLDVWDLLNTFGETVRQLGGGFRYDFTTGKAYLRPPNFTGTTLIPIHVVSAIPGESDDSDVEETTGG